MAKVTPIIDARVSDTTSISTFHFGPDHICLRINSCFTDCDSFEVTINFKLYEPGTTPMDLKFLMIQENI
jgi:hypothetical protein